MSASALIELGDLVTLAFESGRIVAAVLGRAPPIAGG
jgi:hypothetical protein